MKWVLANFTLILVWLINNCHYVHGVGYNKATDQSSKGVDNGDGGGTANYKFEYGVNDGAVGTQFGHEEERNGQQTRGQYRVKLPDGRLQVVTYTADENGYRAVVTYENGESNTGGSGGNDSGGGYENVGAAASSYGPPPQPSSHANNNGGGYSSNENGGSSSGSVGGRGRNSRNFVKLRRTVNGKMFNYMY